MAAQRPEHSHADTWQRGATLKGAPAAETRIRPEVTTAYPAAASGDSRGRDHAVATGTTLGRYVVLDELGRGGMGRVVRAYDPKLQREIAIKQIHRDIVDDASIARFVAEARAMAALSHPNVVSIYDVAFDTHDDLAIIMELVPGQTLAHWLADTPRSMDEIIERFCAAGRGLAAAHDAGILHRDFKPANVLVGSGEITKVTDFGLAKLSHTSDRLHTEETISAATASTTTQRRQPSEMEVDTNAVHFTPSITVTGSILGTPRYMAPEQHWGDKLTAAADQYSFCVSLWEALCGRPPFSDRALAARKQDGPPPWPNNDVPPRVANAIVRGLAPNIHDRWPSMNALLGAIASRPPTRGIRAAAIFSAVGLTALLGTAISSWYATQERKCSGAGAELSTVWSPDRRNEIASALRTVLPQSSGDAEALVAPSSPGSTSMAKTG